MTQLKMRDYPHLPLLPVDKCLRIFQLAGIPVAHLPALLGRSRMTVYLWRQGNRVPVNSALQDVSMMAYKAARALNAHLLPLPAAAALINYQRALSDTHKIPLHDLTAQELLGPLMTPRTKAKAKAPRAKAGAVAHGTP